MDAIILAAGCSVRFGGNKLLCRLNGKPVYRYILELLYGKLQEHVLEHLVVVSQYDEIFQDIKEQFPGVGMVKNPSPEAGISGSIRLGIGWLMQHCAGSRACLFTVADQPGFTAGSLERMLDFWQAHTYGIVAAGHASRPDGTMEIKNPVIFASEYYKELQELTGDTGGKRIVRRHMEDTGLCEIPSDELEDLDTKDMLVRIENKLKFNNTALESALSESFPFLAEKGHVIAIVGAGGKTTLMYTIAAYYAARNNRVIVTTTTHIKCPQRYPVARDRKQLDELLAGNRIVAAGADAPKEKLQASDRMLLSDYTEAADLVLIEADGARHFPCKVPKETEPVIPKESDIVIGVVGMDAVGRPLSECCFRKKEAMELLGVDAAHPMTEQDLVQILLSESGTRKQVGYRDYYIVLNKCDEGPRKKHGKRIQELLVQAGAEHVVCLSLKEAVAGII